MAKLFWLAVFVFVVCAIGIVWYTLRKFKQRQRAEDERAASFLVATAGKPKAAETQAVPAPAAPALPASGDGLTLQKLLFESAHKAGEAGEPALALQLFERLLARYPETAFAEHARTGADAQKKKLAKA